MHQHYLTMCLRKRIVALGTSTTTPLTRLFRKNQMHISEVLAGCLGDPLSPGNTLVVSHCCDEGGDNGGNGGGGGDRLTFLSRGVKEKIGSESIGRITQQLMEITHLFN